MENKHPKILVCITGASGAIYGVRLIEELRKCNAEIHLIFSEWGEKTLSLETPYSLDDLQNMADAVYDVNDMTSAVASGSFNIDSTVIVPCSMKTVSAIANGFSYNLICRSADVALKERRKLVLVPRETPMSSIHLRNLAVISDLGGVILFPLTGYYAGIQTLEQAIDFVVGKIMDQLGIPNKLFSRWG